jgi:putative component of toxin-antitoxin plasmid stabilization module
MKKAVEIRRYIAGNGRDVFGEWISSLRDARTEAKIVAHVDRLALGNFGACKSLGGGLFELRIDWLPRLLRNGWPQMRTPSLRG